MAALLWSNPTGLRVWSNSTTIAQRSTYVHLSPSVGERLFDQLDALLWLDAQQDLSRADWQALLQDGLP
jgi:hypothetical protein